MGFVRKEYVIELRCDYPGHYDRVTDMQSVFTGWNRADAIRQAREYGWAINVNTCTCPLCKRYRKNRSRRKRP